MGQSRPDIMTRPIALCWAAGVKWGLSVPGMQALFVRGALGTNYTAGSNDPHPRREPAPWAPQPPHHQAGKMRVTWDDTPGGGVWGNTPTKHFTY